MWVPLGEDDPYELKSAQWKRLVKFAKGMGVEADHPDEVVDRLGHMVGSLVSVRVVHTPIGPRATMTLPEAPAIKGEVMPMNGAEPTEENATSAHAMHERLVAGLSDTRRGFLQASEACWALVETDGWLALGYESVKEYLASPEIGLQRSAFYDLAAVYRTYVVEGGITPERAAGRRSLQARGRRARRCRGQGRDWRRPSPTRSLWPGATCARSTRA